MKGPSLNFHAERELEHPKTTYFHHFSNYSSTPTYVVVVLFVVKQRSKLHTYRATVCDTPPVEVAEVRFSRTCVVDGEGKRGNVHIPAIMSVDFPDVLFDGFIQLWNRNRTPDRTEIGICHQTENEKESFVYVPGRGAVHKKNSVMHRCTSPNL